MAHKEQNKIQYPRWDERNKKRKMNQPKGLNKCLGMVTSSYRSGLSKNIGWHKYHLSIPCCSAAGATLCAALEWDKDRTSCTFHLGLGMQKCMQIMPPPFLGYASWCGLLPPPSLGLHCCPAHLPFPTPQMLFLLGQWRQRKSSCEEKQWSSLQSPENNREQNHSVHPYFPLLQLWCSGPGEAPSPYKEARIEWGSGCVEQTAGRNRTHTPHLQLKAVASAILNIFSPPGEPWDIWRRPQDENWERKKCLSFCAAFLPNSGGGGGVGAGTWKELLRGCRFPQRLKMAD